MKWVELKNSKYGTLLVLRERRSGRLGTALKVLLSSLLLGATLRLNLLGLMLLDQIVQKFRLKLKNKIRLRTLIV